MEIFVGIDPSINSTGLTIQIYDESNKVKENFYIITGNKLTKKQLLEPEQYSFFDYLKYDKLNVDDAKDNHQNEEFKTFNFIYILDNIIDAIHKAEMYVENVLNNTVSIICIVIEGISYGSTIRTKSVFDLAGLNFMIRYGLYSYKFNSPSKIIIGTPGEIKKYATGIGNANKEMIINIFSLTYPNFKIKKIDDVADSYYMANYSRYLYNKEFK